MRLDQLRSGSRPPLRLPLPPTLSRRRFLQNTAGAAVLATTVGAALGRTAARAASPGIGLPVPIPYGLDFFGDGRTFHVEAPLFPGFGDDPGTVYNFEGTSAIAFVDGLVERRNRKTGETETLPFIASDMRFMSGSFRGRDGHVRAGTFGFI